MATSILHIEDDLPLRGIVTMSLARFGFRGTVTPADTVAQGIRMLEERAHDGHRFDLIVSDMHLSDGTGLDVVRYVRSSEEWAVTPVLILSNDVDPKKIGRAYALGANAYVDKSPPGRTLVDVVRSLYEHWTRDAVFPHPRASAKFQARITEAIKIRSRHARLYERIAQQFATCPTETAFWCSRALAEGNLINLLGFLRFHADDNDLPDELIQSMKQLQASVTACLDAAEKGTFETRDETYRCVLTLVMTNDLELFARWFSYLFPIMPVAAEAIRDFFVSSNEDVARWIGLHTQDPALRVLADQLRASAARLSRVVESASHTAAPL